MNKKNGVRYSLHHIYFYITNTCNLRCRHCWISPKYTGKESPDSVLPVDLFEQIIDEAIPLGLKRVKLTGGEPLLHPHIIELLKILQKKDLIVNIETNGLLLAEDIIKEIKKCKGYFVSVSLDGTNRETHEWIRGAKGAFDATIKAIETLVALGIRPQIIMTIMKKNKDQIEEMVRLAESIGAESVKFNLLQPTARGEELKNSGENVEIKELIKIGKWVETQLTKNTNIRLVYDQPLAFRPLGSMFSENGTGCNRCGIFSILGVLADGSYALCGIGENIPELIFGHAGKDSLESVWYNSPILRKIREGLPGKLEGVCKDCVMKNLCLGSCIAQNYYRKKSLWAPYWFCEMAKVENMFPETRIL